MVASRIRQQKVTHLPQELTLVSQTTRKLFYIWVEMLPYHPVPTLSLVQNLYL